MHAQKLVEKAQDAVERKAYDLAIELYLQALNLEPDHGEAREGLRRAELKKFEAYYPSGLTRLLGTLGSRLSAWFAKGTKNHEKHMMACEQILTKDPKNAKVGLRLAAAAVAAGHRSAAAAAYRGVIEVHPDNLEAQKGLGRMLGQLGRPKEALVAYEKAIALDPRDQEASRMRKNLAAEVSITATGIDVADHSRDVLKDREKTRQLEEGGRVVRSSDDLSERISDLEAQVKADPKDPRLLAELATNYLAARKHDKAIAAYEKAFEIEPSNYVLREKAADIKISRFDARVKKAADADEAERLTKERLEFVVQEYKTRVQNHPTDLVLHFSLGKALYENGDLDGAIAEFQQTIRDPRRKIESLTMLGNCFIGKKMFDLAENQLRKALEESTGKSGERTKEILYSLGLLNEKQDRVQEALGEFKKIYEVDISYRDVGKRMEALREKQAGD